ncbi:MAG: peptide chain release factor N(5)-glutamine methyltransferase [Bdellovibrionales bacterium]|nr:peptide chain release factor N(5)-glutamine methyltransferase [Bdellovibrionales bacterium]
MSPAHPLPATFEEAIKMAQIILGTSPALAERGTIETESEQLVIGAYRSATGRGRTFGRNDLYVRVMDAFPKEAGEKLVVMANRRAHGEPLQYLLGYQYFLNHEYEVDKSVLIPRPETEILVYEVTQTLKRQMDQPKLGLEIGVGSGCVSIELLKLFPGLRMIATEVSEGAAAVARRNAAKILGGAYADRFDVRLAGDGSEIYEPLEEAPWLKGIRADFIVSNPPYLANEKEVDTDVLAHEPKGALFAPAGDPLYFYRKILEGAEAFLKPSGYVFFECPHERIDRIGGLFGPDWKVDGFRDLNDRPRVLRAEWKGISVLN